MAVDPSYERAARFYDAAYASMSSLGPDIDFYEELAAETGGPVLELGCGTGRVLLPIAGGGLACTGIDSSPAMLAQLSSKPGAAPVQLVEADMASFDLGTQRFGLIYSAFRAFQHLLTVEDQLACLMRVRAHLESGGMFACDVFNPNLERLVQDEESESLELKFQLDGNLIERFARVSRDRAAQVAQVTMRYVEHRKGGATEETTVNFAMRWFFRFELEHLLFRAGFSSVEMFGNFDRSPVTRDSPALIAVAR